MSVDIPSVYQRAADLIAERGWCQGVNADGHGRIDAVAAIRLAAGLPIDGGDQWADQDREDDLLRPLQQHIGSLISVWNDADGRTAADVCDALLTVAFKTELTPLMAPQTCYFATTGRTR